jgi:AcrR family transcriptional regulator
VTTETTKPRTARERVRLELTNEIKTVARKHLAEQGSAALSLRAVAREVGMVSSAVYRYFPSRDDLLTALIIDAYEMVGQRVVEGEAAVRRADHLGRWLAACRSVRGWALENPHEYALIFGSPVPGYVAPQDTVDPATIVPGVLLNIMSDAVADGRVLGDARRSIPRRVRSDLHGLRAKAPQLSDQALLAAIMAWTLLIGAVSFELFGHLHNVIFDFDAFFDVQMRAVGIDLGLAAPVSARVDDGDRGRARVSE